MFISKKKLYAFICQLIDDMIETHAPDASDTTSEAELRGRAYHGGMIDGAECVVNAIIRKFKL